MVMNNIRLRSLGCLLISLLLPAFVLSTGSHQEQAADWEADEAWNYEPRIWSFDEPDTNQFDDYPINQDIKGSEPGINLVKDWLRAVDLRDEIVRESSSSDWVEEPMKGTRNEAETDPHEEHYFVMSSDFGQSWTRNRAAEAKECNQFRVDIREAIICDKKRCDKLDFEWPKYDNQIALIQTSRDGMRFKRVDLAMTSKVPRAKFDPGMVKKVSRKDKFKIEDFIEMLKPKPTTTTTTSKPNGSSSTSATTTTEEDDETTSPTTTTTPATSSPVTTTPTIPTRSPDVDPPDPSKSQLITTLRLDTSRLKQPIIGFGGALSDATCRNIKSLSPRMAASLLEDYFGPRGLQYNIARLTMGSSDFSTTPYTNNDRPGDVEMSQTRLLRKGVITNYDELSIAEDMNRLSAGLNQSSIRSRRRRQVEQDSLQDDDLAMNNFKLVEEDLKYKIPVVRQAIATSVDRELKLFSSMWSPPIWMKNNSHIVHGYLKGDVYGPYYRALSELILRWFEAYRTQGIEFWATTGLNEPITGIKPFIFHNSLGITKEDYLTFLKIYLSPMMRQRGFGDVKLIMLDDNKGFLPNYVKSAFRDRQLAKMISGVGFHWYMNDEFENMDFVSRDYPDKFLLSTEACNGYRPFQVHTLPGDWDRGVAYMIDVLSSLKHGAGGWVDWNMALDLGGGPSWAKNLLDAAVIVNGPRDEYYKSPMFYALGHFSRFLEPNSRRLDHRLAYALFDAPFDLVAFLTPKNYIVIVALNQNRMAIPVKIIVNRQLIRVINLRAMSFTTVIFKSPAA